MNKAKEQQNGAQSAMVFCVAENSFRKINDVYGVILTVEAKDTNDVETLFGQFADLQQLVEQWGKQAQQPVGACLLQQTELDVPQWVKAVDETVAAIRSAKRLWRRLF